MFQVLLLIALSQVLAHETYAATIATPPPSVTSNPKQCPANETLYPCGPHDKPFMYESQSTCDPLMNVLLTKNCPTLIQECDCMSGYIRESLTHYKCIKKSDCPKSSFGHIHIND